MTDKDRQKGVLHGRQMNFLPAQPDLPGNQVDLEIPMLIKRRRILRFRFRMAQRHAQSGRPARMAVAVMMMVMRGHVGEHQDHNAIKSIGRSASALTRAPAPP